MFRFTLCTFSETVTSKLSLKCYGVEKWITAMLVYGNCSYRSGLSKSPVEFSKVIPPVWPYFDNATLDYAVVFCTKVLVMNTKAIHYKQILKKTNKRARQTYHESNWSWASNRDSTRLVQTKFIARLQKHVTFADIVTSNHIHKPKSVVIWSVANKYHASSKANTANQNY